jgi:hypothetical protein
VTFCEYRVLHRTVPSFTVEIKRARKPSVHGLTRKVAAPEWDTHHRPKTLPFDDLFAAPKPPSHLSLGRATGHDGPQASVGRLLPSLASVNSLQVREQQETREEPARQRRAREVSGRVETSDAPDSVTASGEALASSSTKAELVPPTPAMQEAHVTASDSPEMPSADTEQRRNTKGKDYRTAYRRAVRRGLPLPQLPAGERWKRRLPPICR